VVQTPEQQSARWHRLIDEGLPAATIDARERLGNDDAVQAEFHRVAVKLDEVLNGEPNDVAALVLHATLVSLCEKAVDLPEVN